TRLHTLRIKVKHCIWSYCRLKPSYTKKAQQITGLEAF
ncbi:MAG: hypothetical protein ACI97H_000585, partial [Marinobacter psychrophilus]